MADITTKYKSKWTGAEIDDGIEKARNAVPLDGSKAMTGALKLQNSGATGGSYFQDAGANNLTIIVRNDFSDANVARYLQLFNSAGQSDIKEALRLRDRTAAGYANYNILHTGNKPSGSYTGNGSSASRTIEIGGIGQVVMVYSAYGIALVTANGAMCDTGEFKHLNAGSANFYQNLYLTTADDILNHNGVTYTYQVL